MFFTGVGSGGRNKWQSNYMHRTHSHMFSVQNEQFGDTKRWGLRVGEGELVCVCVHVCVCVCVCLCVTLTCSERTILGLSKFIPHGDHNAARAKDENEHKVSNLGFNTAVETVVQPWHKGANGQQGNPTIVQSESKSE